MLAHKSIWTSVIVLVAIVLLAVAPVAAQDGGEAHIPWSTLANTATGQQYAADIQAAALALDYIDHVSMEWTEPPSEAYQRMIVVRIYFDPANHRPVDVFWDVMRNLTVMFPERWGHVAPYLPGA